MYSVLNTLSEYIYFYISKTLLHTLFLLVIKIAESLYSISLLKLVGQYHNVDGYNCERTFHSSNFLKVYVDVLHLTKTNIHSIKCILLK